MRNPVPRSRRVSRSSVSGLLAGNCFFAPKSFSSPRARYEGYSSDAYSSVMHDLFCTNEPVERRLTDDSNDSSLTVLRSHVARRGDRLIRKATNMIGPRRSLHPIVSSCLIFIPLSIHQFQNDYLFAISVLLGLNVPFPDSSSSASFRLNFLRFSSYAV